MKILLKYGKVLLINILSFLIILFFLTLIYYFNGIDDKTYSLLKLITLLISIFIQSFSLVKKRMICNSDKPACRLAVKQQQAKLCNQDY